MPAGRSRNGGAGGRTIARTEDQAMKHRSKAFLLYAALATIGAAPAGAAGTQPSPMSPADIKRELAMAQAHIDNGQYRRAVSVLDNIVATNRKNADAHNLLGFSHRKMGNVDRAERHYDYALVLAPTHRGALEYVGELYLQTGRRADAEAVLTRLEKACPAGCPELDELRAALAGSAKNW
jgi:Flp pilus assembly protein TadD